jgi:hypothetical protein
MTIFEIVYVVVLGTLATVSCYLITRINILRNEVIIRKGDSEFYEGRSNTYRHEIERLNNERSDFKLSTENNFINTLSIGDEFTPIGDGPISKGGSTIWTESFKGSKNTVTEIDYVNRKFVSCVEGHETFDISFDSVKDMLWVKTNSSNKVKFKFV